MRNPHDIIIKPIITEQSMDDMAFNKYTFKVAKDANKSEIKKAIEKIFNVEVESVNTMNILGKMKRMGTTQGRKSSWKKAVVSLTPESDSIEFFEGM